MAIRRELSNLIPNQTNILKRWTRWKRFETPALTVLSNPIDMYYIRKENAYNQRVKDAINNENLLVLPWINKNKKDHVYLWELKWNTLRIIDPYNNKVWGVTWAYKTYNNWEWNNYELAKTRSDKYKWADISTWNQIKEKLWKIQNEDWTTLQDLFDKYPDGTIFDEEPKKNTAVPSSYGKRKYS